MENSVDYTWFGKTHSLCKVPSQRSNSKQSNEFSVDHRQDCPAADLC